jgi:hypothetical protein
MRHTLQLLDNNNNNLPFKEADIPECPATVPVTSTGVPGVSDDQRLEISTNAGKCFRIFNCVDDKPVPYSEYSCKISDIKGDWWGEHFYQVRPLRVVCVGLFCRRHVAMVAEAGPQGRGGAPSVDVCIYYDLNLTHISCTCT